jgi:dTDP-4-dehydrorhamnose reductase
MKGNQTLLADGYAIKHHGANIAKAVNDLAQNKPEVAMALERLGQSTPYAALVMAVVPLALQLAANHIPKFTGLPMTHSVEDLAGAALQEMGIEVTDEGTED